MALIILNLDRGKMEAVLGLLRRCFKPLLHWTPYTRWLVQAPALHEVTSYPRLFTVAVT